MRTGLRRALTALQQADGPQLLRAETGDSRGRRPVRAGSCFRCRSLGKRHVMPVIPAPPVPLSQVGRAAHDIGLAGLLGGTLFGRLALHPSVTEISNQAERGKIVNAAWRRYGIVNSLSLLAVVGGWIGARANEAAPDRLSK